MEISVLNIFVEGPPLIQVENVYKKVPTFSKQPWAPRLNMHQHRNLCFIMMASSHMYLFLKFVCNLRQVGGYFPSTVVSFTNKTDRHEII